MIKMWFEYHLNVVFCIILLNQKFYDINDKASQFFF